MVYQEKVQGSAEQAQPLIINVDTIYVHKNIVKLEPKEDENGKIVNENMYEYDEYQYSFAEFPSANAQVMTMLEDEWIDQYTLLLVEKGIL